MMSSPSRSRAARRTGDEPVPAGAGEPGDRRDGIEEEPHTTGHLRQRRMSAGYAIVFLVFLVFPALQLWRDGGWRGWMGLALLVVFAVVYAGGYLGSLLGMRPFHVLTRAGPVPWLLGLVALTAVLTAVAGLSALVCLTYVATGAAASLPSRPAVLTVTGCALVVGAGTLLLTADWLWAIGLGLWVAVIGLIVWGGVAMDRHNDALTRAREEKAELAVELERSRLARDLHDILGHSLTVITVKAELAGRLVDGDPARAKAEIADLERLSRDALADVRATVSGYRQLSLPTELARARRALEAAGIAAIVPGAADVVDARWRDLFAWVVREGSTNVVRHSRAHHCEITLAADAVQVRDDGDAPAQVLPGNGLTGLRERARQVGASVHTTSSSDGFVLRVRAGKEAG